MTDSLTINYAGTINDNISTLNVPIQIVNKSFSFHLYKSASYSSFLTKSYALLNSDCLWYPSTILPALYGDNTNKKRDFTNFKLSVKVSPPLLPISQGKRHIFAPNNYMFHQDAPLFELSLIIGKYEHNELNTDHCTYHLYHHPKHDYYKKLLSLDSSDIREVVKELEDECYSIIPIEYPYSDFSLVETPIQFTSFCRFGSSSTNRTPPQMSLLHEQNVVLWHSNFTTSEPELLNSFSSREIDKILLKRYLKTALFSSNLGTSTYDKAEAQGFILVAPIFPQLYSNSICFANDTLGFNASIDAYLFSQTIGNFTSYFPFQNWLWLSQEEKLNLSLMENRITNSAPQTLYDFDKHKRRYFSRSLLIDQNQDEFNDRLFNFINSHQHQLIDLDSLSSIIPNILSNTYPLPQLLPDKENELPAFVYSDFKLYETINNNQTRYQVFFSVENVSNAPGLFEVYFLKNEDHLDWRRETVHEAYKVIHLDKMSSAQIGIILDFKPTAITLNPIIAQNLPLWYGKRLTPIAKNIPLFEGIRPLKCKEPILDTIYIVDNIDESFDVNTENKSYLSRIIRKNQNNNPYENFKLYDPPTNWADLKHLGFFGAVQKTALFKKTGDGNSLVTWHANLKKDGQYKIYAYMPPKDIFRKNGNLRIKELRYTIYCDDGEVSIALDFENTSEGWNELGEFYCSKGQAKVELSDESKGLLVLADAVKWELH